MIEAIDILNKPWVVKTWAPSRETTIVKSPEYGLRTTKAARRIKLIRKAQTINRRAVAWHRQKAAVRNHAVNVMSGFSERKKMKNKRREANLANRALRAQAVLRPKGKK